MFGISGCWLAAAQFAPLAANAAEYVGSSALELAGGAAASSHGEAARDKQYEDARQAAMSSGDNCNQLEVQVPDVIELRRSASGAPEYRELRSAARSISGNGRRLPTAKRTKTVGGRQLIFSR